MSCKVHAAQCACAIAGAAYLSADDESLHQEPGSGIHGHVNGSLIAVGNLDWVTEHHASTLDQHSSEQLAQLDDRQNSGIASTSNRHDHELSLAPGNTAVFMTIDGQLAGTLHAADTLRPEAWETVHALQRRGLQVALLSGESVMKQEGPHIEAPHMINQQSSDRTLLGLSSCMPIAASV